MAYTNTWTVIAPAGSAAANTVDDEIRKLRLDMEERLEEFLIENMSADPVVRKIGTSQVNAARAWTGATFALPDGADTAINLVQETFDTGSFHDNSINPSRLTVTDAAYYQIRAVVGITSGSTVDKFGLLTIKKNGTIIAGWRKPHHGGTTVETYMVSVIDLAAATDYYEVYLSQSSGDAWATLNSETEAFLEIIRMS